MKVIIGTSIAPITIFIIFVLSFIYFIEIQFIYSRTIDNELITNAFDTVEKATTGNSEITESLNNASASTEDDTTITSNISKQQNQSEYKIYESPIIGVKFKMPSTWYIYSESNNTKDCFDEVFFTSPYANCQVVLINNKTWYKTDFKIYVLKYMITNYSLIDYLTYGYQTIKQQEGYSFINDKEMTLQNNPAWQIIYSLNGHKQMSIVTKINNTFYSLTYRPTFSYDYSKYLPKFENFVKSLEFIPSIKPEEIEPIEPIKLKPSFLKYSTLENITNNNEIIEQTQGSKITTSNNIIADLLFDKYYPIVKVDYESDSMVVLEANENYLSEINGSLVPFWESIDIVKNQGYSLNEITTLGTGSIENPIIFYAYFLIIPITR